ncbi:hypothetical protein D3C73_1440690 [compost metagenome]
MQVFRYHDIPWYQTGIKQCGEEEIESQAVSYSEIAFVNNVSCHGHKVYAGDGAVYSNQNRHTVSSQNN